MQVTLYVPNITHLGVHTLAQKSQIIARKPTSFSKKADVKKTYLVS